MKITELSIMELKAYFDLINEKIKRLNIDIEINGGNKDKFDVRSKLFTIKTQFENEIDKRIKDIELE